MHMCGCCTACMRKRRRTEPCTVPWPTVQVQEWALLRVPICPLQLLLLSILGVCCGVQQSHEEGNAVGRQSRRHPCRTPLQQHISISNALVSDPMCLKHLSSRTGRHACERVCPQAGILWQHPGLCAVTASVWQPCSGPGPTGCASRREMPLTAYYCAGTCRSTTVSQAFTLHYVLLGADTSRRSSAPPSDCNQPRI